MDQVQENGEELAKYINKHISVSDSISTAHHTRQVRDMLRNMTDGDKILIRKLLDVVNEHAIQDSNFSVKFAICMSSNQWRLMDGDNVMQEIMINILQKNYTDREELKKSNYQHLYNAIRTHGEYFNRFRLMSGRPVRILGSFCLQWLTTELNGQMEKDLLTAAYAELVFGQLQQNGKLFEQNCPDEVKDLMLAIRKCLIVGQMDVETKMFLLMALDLFYIKGPMDVKLQKMYLDVLLETRKKVTAEDSQPEKVDSGVDVTESIEALSIDADCSESAEPVIILKTPEELEQNLNTKNYKLYKKKRNSLDSDEPTPSNTTSQSDDTSSVSEARTQDSDWTTDSLDTSFKLTEEQENNFNKNRFQRGKKPQVQTQTQQSPRFFKENKNDSNRQQSAAINGRHPEPYSPPRNDNDNNYLQPQLNLRINCDDHSAGSSDAHWRGMTSPKAAYFREENVENLTWDAGLCWDDQTPSPKANPQTTAFLSFLKQN